MPQLPIKPVISPAFSGNLVKKRRIAMPWETIRMHSPAACSAMPFTAPYTRSIRQAKAAKAWFDAHNVHFDAVYSSTSERACDTAEFVSGGMSYTRRKDLKEIFLGIKEASPIRENPTYPYGDYFVKYGESAG